MNFDKDSDYNSDMNFDNLTDPKKSKPLIEFNKKLRNTNIND